MLTNAVTAITTCCHRAVGQSASSQSWESWGKLDEVSWWTVELLFLGFLFVGIHGLMMAGQTHGLHQLRSVTVWNSAVISSQVVHILQIIYGLDWQCSLGWFSKLGWCRSTVAVGINLGSSNRLFEAVGSVRWGINFWISYRRDLGQIWLDIGERFWFQLGIKSGTLWVWFARVRWCTDEDWV